MKSIKSLLSVILLSGNLGLSVAPVSAAEGIISKVPASNYCHMKFPAIREETLGSDRPVLKDGNSGDVIDFYGPCNYDPLGKDSVWRQRLDRQHMREHEYSD
jgi:hypothetical protein